MRSPGISPPVCRVGVLIDCIAARESLKEDMLVMPLKMIDPGAHC